MSLVKMIAFLIVFSAYFTRVQLFEFTNILDHLEEKFIRFQLYDCTFRKNLFGLTYEKQGAQANIRLSGVFLKLYTANATVSYPLSTASSMLASSPDFNKNLLTVIVIHGYFVSSTSTNIANLAAAIKSLGNLNVMMLDHSSMTKIFNYFLATTNTQYVGEALGKFLSQMYTLGVQNFHLVGHSLGAHISGFAGKVYTQTTGATLQKITGLDPAGPCFFTVPADKRLTKSDATFIDVIHTETGSLGYADSLGHVDFYPNKGEDMPGCFDVICGHGRSTLYYTESIWNKNGFLSVACADWKTFLSGSCKNNVKYPMGYWIPSNIPSGNYYLKTSDRSPYGLGANGV